MRSPANYDPAKKYPAVVVAHPNGGVKEQVAGLFAQRLANLGCITIAMNAAGQLAAMPFVMYREGAIYYERTHTHPNSGASANSSGTYTVSSLLDLMRWDATDRN